MSESLARSVIAPDRVDRGIDACNTHDHHLATDHLLADLETTAASSGVVTLGSQGAQFVLNLVSIMALARLLSPSDFGLVAMAMTVMGFLQAFRESGLSRATIQREGITHAQVSNLFWLNVAIGIATALTLVAAAPLIAWFYREPRLVAVTVALALGFPLSALTVQHTALLMRRMRFKALAVVQVLSQSIGVATAIVMAWWGYRYWSLVGMQLVSAVTVVALTYIAVPWRPQAPKRRSGTRPLVAFGSNLAAGSLIFSIARGSDTLAIGRFWGSDALGLYSRGGALLRRPLDQLLAAAEAVMVPMLSRLQHQPDRYRATFLQFYEATAMASCLLTSLMLALARPITVVVLGPDWEDAALIFAGFTLSALCAPLVAVASWLFITQGRGGGMLRSTCVVSGLFVVSVIVGLPFGGVGVAFASSVIALAFGVPVLYYWAGREGPVRTSDLWSGLLRHVPLWAGVFGVALVTQLLLRNFDPLIQLISGTTTGALTGASIILVSAPLRRTAAGVFRTLKQFRRGRVGSVSAS